MNKERDPKEGAVTDVRDTRAFDRRTVDRNMKRGLVNRKDYEKFLKSLPDSAEKVRPGDT